MLLRDISRLEKIIEYCSRIERSITRYGDKFDVFEADEDYQQSVCFSLLQIGELVNGLSEEYLNATRFGMPWHQIKGMRNVVVHGYGSIDRSVVWNTLTGDIPELKKFCIKQLETVNDGSE